MQSSRTSTGAVRSIPRLVRRRDLLLRQRVLRRRHDLPRECVLFRPASERRRPGTYRSNPKVRIHLGQPARPSSAFMAAETAALFDMMIGWCANAALTAASA